MVGCDWGIESDAVEDVCGMCHGDGTTCTKVTESFDKKSGLGWLNLLYLLLFRIPHGRNKAVH